MDILLNRSSCAARVRYSVFWYDPPSRNTMGADELLTLCCAVEQVSEDPSMFVGNIVYMCLDIASIVFYLFTFYMGKLERSAQKYGLLRPGDNIEKEPDPEYK